jgi:hypothetical protein
MKPEETAAVRPYPPRRASQIWVPVFLVLLLLGNLVFQKQTSNFYFETKFCIYFIYQDSAGCIANYYINAVLKQTSYFEHCLGWPSIDTRVADERAGLRRALADPSWTSWTSALLPLHTHLLYGPTSRTGSSRGHLRPCVPRFLVLAFTTVQGLESNNTDFRVIFFSGFWFCWFQLPGKKKLKMKTQDLCLDREQSTVLEYRSFNITEIFCFVLFCFITIGFVPRPKKPRSKKME